MQVSDDELLICRSKHICTFGEGGRTFSKAFMDRFLVRDMALMADHNNFMSFDINSEKDTLLKLEGFARYVMQPLNPVLQDRLNRLEPLRQIKDESRVNSSAGSQVEGASSGGKQSSHGISSLQRAARTTLINFANQRKGSFLFDS